MVRQERRTESFKKTKGFLSKQNLNDTLALKELLERDSDFSSTLKAICEKGEFDYKVTKYNGDKNQHMIAPFGFYDGQEDSSSDLLQKGKFLPMPSPEEQEMAPPMDVNNDGEAG